MSETHHFLTFKTDSDIEELVRLGISPMFIFTPCYNPSYPLFYVVAKRCTPYGYFLNCQEGCIAGTVLSLLLVEPVLSGTPGLPVVHLRLKFLQGLP